MHDRCSLLGSLIFVIIPRVSLHKSALNASNESYVLQKSRGWTKVLTDARLERF